VKKYFQIIVYIHNDDGLKKKYEKLLLVMNMDARSVYSIMKPSLSVMLLLEPVKNNIWLSNNRLQCVTKQKHPLMKMIKIIRKALNDVKIMKEQR
jgi:hypothetical protein